MPPVIIVAVKPSAPCTAIRRGGVRPEPRARDPAQPRPTSRSSSSWCPRPQLPRRSDDVPALQRQPSAARTPCCSAARRGTPILRRSLTFGTPEQHAFVGAEPTYTATTLHGRDLPLTPPTPGPRLSGAAAAHQVLESLSVPSPDLRRASNRYACPHLLFPLWSVNLWSDLI
jgi:hypothetical protein